MNAHNLIGATAIALVVFVMGAATASAEGLIYETSFSELGGGLMVNVDFHGRMPAPEVANQVLRESMMTAAQVNASTTILGSLFHNDDSIREPGYHRQLVYIPETGKIITFEEYLSQ